MTASPSPTVALPARTGNAHSEDMYILSMRADASESSRSERTKNPPPVGDVSKGIASSPYSAYSAA